MLKHSVTVSPEFESNATYIDVPATAVFRPSGLKESTDTGRGQRFLTYDVFIKQGQGKIRKLTFVLAEVGWFTSHPEKHWYPEPLEVWCSDFSQVSFIAVQRIHSQC